jgi:hypothetical protein
VFIIDHNKQVQKKLKENDGLLAIALEESEALKKKVIELNGATEGAAQLETELQQSKERVVALEVCMYVPICRTSIHACVYGRVYVHAFLYYRWMCEFVCM